MKTTGIETIIPLPQAFAPAIQEIVLPAEDLLTAAQEELRVKAQNDPSGSGCWGYFPGYEGTEIDSDLPNCHALAEAIPAIQWRGFKLPFSFVRYALTDQAARAPFHLDGDASSALTDTLETGIVLRALVHLGTTGDRAVHFLPTIGHATVVDHGYRRIVNDPEPEEVRTLYLPPRNGRTASAAMIYANAMFHAGDVKAGDFVASFGAVVGSQHV